MLGLSAFDLIPGSVLETMLHENAGSGIAMAVDAMRNMHELAEGESPCIMLFVVPATDSKPESLGALMAAMGPDGNVTRRFAWHDLRELLQTIPVAAMLKVGKEMGEATERAEKARAKLDRYTGTDVKKIEALKNDLKTALDAALAASAKMKDLRQPKLALAAAPKQLAAHSEGTDYGQQ